MTGGRGATTTKRRWFGPRLALPTHTVGGKRWGACDNHTVHRVLGHHLARRIARDFLPFGIQFHVGLAFGHDDGPFASNEFVFFRAVH